MGSYYIPPVNFGLVEDNLCVPSHPTCFVSWTDQSTASASLRQDPR